MAAKHRAPLSEAWQYFDIEYVWVRKDQSHWAAHCKACIDAASEALALKDAQNVASGKQPLFTCAEDLHKQGMCFITALYGDHCNFTSHSLEFSNTISKAYGWKDIINVDIHIQLHKHNPSCKDSCCFQSS